MDRIALAATASLFMPVLFNLPASSRPLPEIRPVTDATDYTCFVITNDRRAFDLTSMCGGSGLNATSRGNISPLDANGRILANRSSPRQKSSVKNTSGKVSRQNNRVNTPSPWSWLPESIGSVFPSQLPSGGTSTTGASSANTGTSGGSCNSPDDLDARGNPCGGRAAEKKPGGR